MKNTLSFVFSLILVALISCSKDNNEELTPAPAVLVFPENNTECNEGNVLSSTQSEVTFRWNASENTDNYTLNVTLIEESTIQIVNITSPEATVTLVRGKTYSWYVISHKNSSSVDAQSPVWTFYNAGIPTENNIPFQAELVSPLHDSNLPAGQVTLQWTSSDLNNDIIEHQILMNTEYPPTSIKGTLTGNSFDIVVEAYKTYYWQVVTIDQTGSKSFSNIFSFNVGEASEIDEGDSGTSTSTISDNLILDGAMDDTNAWQYRQLWINSDNEVNHGFVNGEFAFRSVQGVSYSNAIIWQEVPVESGVGYRFDIYLRSGGTANSWVEIYFGTDDPIESASGDDYTSNGAQIFVKSFGNNENCGVNSFEGSIFDIVTNGCSLPSDSLIDSNGDVTFASSNLTSNGTIFIGIKAGNYDGTFGTGVFINNVSLVPN
jgi:hypothetical protein